MSFSESVQVFRVQPIRFVERPEKTTRYSRSFNGCTRCKVKHRKCDQKRPSCSRCVTAGSPCTYEQPVNHYKPRKSAASPSDKRQPASSPTTVPERPPNLNSKEPHDADQQSMPLVSSLKQSPEDAATTSLLKGDPTFIRSCGFDEMRNIVDMVRDMPSTSPAWSCLKSFGTMSLSLSSRDSALYQRSLETKSVAMNHLRRALSSSTPVTEIILSVMLIGGVDSVFPDGVEKGQWHWRALGDLFRRDEPAMLKDPVYQNLTTTLALGTSWLTGVVGTLPPAIDKALSQPDPLFPPQSWQAFRRTLLRLSWRAAGLRSRAVAFNADDCDPNAVDALYQDACALLSSVDMAIWSLPRPQTFHTQSYKLHADTVADASIYPGELYIYPTAEHTVVYLRLQAVKLMVLIAVIQCVLHGSAVAPRRATCPPPQLMQVQPPTDDVYQRRQVVDQKKLSIAHLNFRKVADDVCAVIPSVSNIDWSQLPEDLVHLRHISLSRDMECADLPSTVMHFVSTIECLPALQVAWLKGRQQRLADVYGLPCAGIFASRQFPGAIACATRGGGSLLGSWYIVNGVPDMRKKASGLAA